MMNLFGFDIDSSEPDDSQDEPIPRPPNVRIVVGTLKKKRSTKNDISQDPTKL